MPKGYDESWPEYARRFLIVLGAKLQGGQTLTEKQVLAFRILQASLEILDEDTLRIEKRTAWKKVDGALMPRLIAVDEEAK